MLALGLAASGGSDGRKRLGASTQGTCIDRLVDIKRQSHIVGSGEAVPDTRGRWLRTMGPKGRKRTW